ncbi:glycosyltransferase family 87 protein [Iodidimonas sp. SYSU 1G8]|uniref:glycosyltransferase family 87 protein n=1 Tax=Iodidimonas sp. SYSU 1G8 TaxID=3133967 RepID=UPI0031FEE073
MSLHGLRSGAWLTRGRLTAYPFIFLVLGMAGVIWAALSDNGVLTPDGLPLGADFINVYATSYLVLQGSPEIAYDPVRHNAVEHALIDFDPGAYFGWHYPPMALFLVAPLALLPFMGALFVWLGVTFLGYLAVLRATVPKDLPVGPAVLALVGFTGVFINVINGQNGFLTTGLLGAAFLALARGRPWLAGVLIACLLYKPQFGVLIPLALLAGGYWRSVIAASAAGLILIAASYLVFGAETWQAFLGSTTFTRDVVLEAGGTGWHRIQSIFSMVRMAGGGIEVAYAAQMIVLLGLALLVVVVWRRPSAPFEVKAALLAAGSLLATPYVLDYDLIVLALVLAWVTADGLKRGFLPWEKSFLALIWLWPLLSRMLAQAAQIQFSPLILGILVWMLYRRAGPLPSVTSDLNVRPA